MHTSEGTVVRVTGFSPAIGLFFGVYPATRAAGLISIETLRYEEHHRR